MAALSNIRLGIVGLICRNTGRSLLRRSIANKNGLKVAVLGSHPVANLTSTQGEPMPRPKPWPYKTRKYNMFYELFDKTTKRLDDNSKVIVVEGNIGIDKVTLAQDIAKEFDLLYVPEPSFDDIFTLKWSGFDVRELDEQLPEGAQAWDLKRFNTDPKAKGSAVGIFQVYHYINRTYKYAAAVHHMLSTGQGVVMVRSPFSDHVFADTMAKFGYLTPQGLKYYNMIRDTSICDMLRPHVVIYLDAPVSSSRDGIKKRNISHEVNSKVLTDEYLQSISDVYKNKYLPNMRKSSAILTYNLEEGPLDMEVITEELERLDLDKAPEENPRRFKDWILREDEWAYYRKYYASAPAMAKLFSRPQPMDAPELMMSPEDSQVYTTVCNMSPGVKYEKGYNPEKDNVYFKL